MTWSYAWRRREKQVERQDPARPVERGDTARPVERPGLGRPAQQEGQARRLRRRGPAHPVVRASAMVTAFAGTVLFGVVLARLTLEPSAASAALVHANVRPGSSINAYLNGTSTIEAVRQLGGNVLLGVPFGVLLPVLLPPARGLLRVGIVTACLMTLVELVQGALVTGRVFDIDDVILNTAGALLGYLLIGRRLGRAVHPRRRHWWNRRAAEPLTPDRDI
ncbi:VanZ family protein [Streptomyces roseus]|nr:VanZ family protein [Streptomyces roseus]